MGPFFSVSRGRKGVQGPWGFESFSFKPQERAVMAPQVLSGSSGEGGDSLTALSRGSVSWGRWRNQRDLLLGTGCREGGLRGIRPQGQREALGDAVTAAVGGNTWEWFCDSEAPPVTVWDYGGCELVP